MASRFWVGGTGTWDASDTSHWASSTGGSSGASVPGSSDTVTFDANSGGGTVTPASTTINIQSMTFGAFTGTLDFSANNPDVNISSSTGALSGTGSGTRTFNMGSGTWTITATATATVINFGTITNLTFSGGSANVVLDGANANRRTASFGAITDWGNVTLGGSGGGGITLGGPATFASLTISAGLTVSVTAPQTNTITGAFTWTGTSSSPILIRTNNDTAVTTLAAANGGSGDWCGIRQITFTGAGGKTFSNSQDYGRNTGATINAPSGGSAGMLYIPSLEGL